MDELISDELNEILEGSDIDNGSHASPRPSSRLESLSGSSICQSTDAPDVTNSFLMLNVFFSKKLSLPTKFFF